MNRIKYRIFISDYQDFRYYRTLKEARRELTAEGYTSFQYAKYDPDVRLYCDRGYIWL